MSHHITHLLVFSQYNLLSGYLDGRRFMAPYSKWLAEHAIHLEFGGFMERLA